MKYLSIIGSILLIALTMGCSEKQSIYEYKETKNLVGLVNDAADLIAKKGDKAFDEFNRRGTKWRHDNVYILVYDKDKEIRLVYPPHPEKIGEKMSAIIDPNGKPIGKWFLEQANDKEHGNEGWVFYQWAKPGTKKLSWKAAFSKLAVDASGRQYIVSSGIYDFKTEKMFIEGLVNEAAELIGKHGRDAFSTFNERSGKFLFRDFYIFVSDEKGNMLVNSVFQDLVGKNVFNMKDPTGKYFVREFINAALLKGSGWVNYLWPKPGAEFTSEKSTYVKSAKFGNETFIVGAGYYKD